MSVGLKKKGVRSSRVALIKTLTSKNANKINGRTRGPRGWRARWILCKKYETI